MLVRIALLFISLILMSCSDNDTDEAAPVTDESYLVQNAAREGVVVTESGLQYEVLRAAEGEMPSANSIVTVHYTGELIDGTEFDSSYARGEPNTFNLSGTILGWVEGVQLMSVGSMFRLVVPAHLGYADRGAPPAIMPGATLIYDVELLEVNSN